MRQAVEVFEKFPTPFGLHSDEGEVAEAEFFECVGEIEESAMLMAKLSRTPAWHGDVVVEQLSRPLPFDEKKYTGKEVLDALRVNFQGHEAMRSYLRNLPKYGGGNQEAKANEQLRDYTTNANKLITRSATVGDQFGTLKDDVKAVSRDDAARKLQSMIDSCKQIAHDATLLKVPSNAVTLQPRLQNTFDMRVTGVDKYRTALLDVLGGGAPMPSELSALAVSV